MSSNLACIGFDPTGGLDLDHLVRTVGPRAVLLGERDGRRVLRWDDDEGARIVLVTTRSGGVENLTPSFVSEPGAVLGALTPLNEDCWSAAVLQGGEQVTALAADLEQAPLVDPASGAGGSAAVVALGVAVQVFADEGEFAASPASLLTDDDGEPGEPPAHYVENGWSWPPRMGAESFISYGVFGDAAQAEPYARLNGTVLRSRTCRNSVTGAAFHVARVRTVGFEADVCLAADEHPQAPAVGAVVGGTVYLVVSVESFAAAPAAPRRGLRLPWKR